MCCCTHTAKHAHEAAAVLREGACQLGGVLLVCVSVSVWCDVCWQLRDALGRMATCGGQRPGLGCAWCATGRGLLLLLDRACQVGAVTVRLHGVLDDGGVHIHLVEVGAGRRGGVVRLLCDLCVLLGLLVRAPLVFLGWCHNATSYIGHSKFWRQLHSHRQTQKSCALAPPGPEPHSFAAAGLFFSTAEASAASPAAASSGTRSSGPIAMLRRFMRMRNSRSSL